MELLTDPNRMVLIAWVVAVGMSIQRASEESARGHASKWLAVALALLLLPSPAFAQSVLLPVGTTVYGELAENVVSKKKFTHVDDRIEAFVWRDVIVDGQVVIERGAPVRLRVAKVKRRKLAGIPGKVDLEARSLVAVDGSEIPLEGGYGRAGRRRTAAVVALATLLAWQMVLIRGKDVVLETGTVFSTTVTHDRWVEIDTMSLKLPANAWRSEAVVLDDLLAAKKKPRYLPLQLRRCDGGLTDPALIRVSGREIPRMPVLLESLAQIDDCSQAVVQVELKALRAYLVPGINWLEFEAGGERFEVVLDLEL